MKQLLTGAAMALALGVPAGVLFAPAPAAAVVQAQEAGVERTATGVIVTPAEGPARRVRLRVMGPRIIHALLPIPNKGTSDWGYAWIPVVGPLIGGALSGLIFNAAF